MSLVAYESSGDESESGDENEEKQEQTTPVLVGPKLPGQVGPKLPDVEMKRGTATKKSSYLQIDEDVKQTSTEIDIVDDEWETNPSKANRTEEIEQRTTSSGSSSRGSIFSFLPPPKKGSSNFIVEETGDIPTAAKSQHVNIQRNETENSVNNVNDELDESEQKVTDSRSIKKLVLPKPTNSSSVEGKQRVKIALPSLPDAGSDSDDETKESVDKKRKRLQGKSKSSLLGRLPQPKYSASMSKGPLPKASERKASLLVPYTLTKKKEDDKSETKTTESAENDSESDEEQPSVSFFTFGSKEEAPDKLGTTIKKENIFKSNVPVDKLLSEPNPATKNTTNTRNLTESSRTNTHTEKSTVLRAINDHPKTDLSKEDRKPDIKTNPSSSSTVRIPSSKLPAKEPEVSVIGPYSSESFTGPYESSNVTGPYLSNSVTGPYNVEPVTGSYGSQSVTGRYMSADVTSPYIDSNSGAYSGSSVGTYLDANGQNAYDTNHHMSGAYLNPEPTGYNQYDQYGSYGHEKQGMEVAESIDADQLRRLQGKRERAIQEVDFIDIHGENMQLDSSTVLKNVTEDAPIRPKMSKKDMPSSQQKRKHQITYLAFQAKEREDELRKSWAASAHSKRQTQQKYGF